MILGKYQLLFNYKEIWARFQNNLSYYSFNYIIVTIISMIFCSIFSLSFFLTTAVGIVLLLSFFIAAGAVLYFTWWRSGPLVIADRNVPLRAIQGAIGTGIT